jgi:Spy/CpxP family protein refolding chaperone
MSVQPMTKGARSYEMLKKICTGAIFMILVGTPLSTLAQERPAGKWWQLPQVSKELNLKSDEKKELENLFVENRRKLIELKSDVERARLDLDVLLDRTPLDEDAIKKQYNLLERARESLARERFRFLLEVRRMLGPDRFGTLKGMFRQFKVQRRRSPVKLKPKR